jgi:hypothetical protein
MHWPKHHFAVARIKNGRAVPETTRVINDVASFFQKPLAKVLSGFTNATEDKISAIVKMKSNGNHSRR